MTRSPLYERNMPKKRKRRDTKKARDKKRSRLFFKYTRGEVGRWGLWDGQEKVWLGDERGPQTYASRQAARIAARVRDYQIGTAAGRVEVRRYDGSGNRLKYAAPVRLDGAEVLKRIEAGILL